jgi:hypothetical protein
MKTLPNQITGAKVAGACGFMRLVLSRFPSCRSGASRHFAQFWRSARRNTMKVSFTGLVSAAVLVATSVWGEATNHVMRGLVTTNASGATCVTVYVEGRTNKATTMPELTSLLKSLPKGSSLTYKPRYGQFHFWLGTNRFKRYQILEELCASNHIKLNTVLVPDL